MSYFIYVIGPKEPPIKIGITGDINQRLRSLQTGHSSKLFVHHQEEITDSKTAKLFEGIIHKNLKHLQTHGEWFNLSIEDAINHVKWCIIRYENEPNLSYRKRAGLLFN